MLPPRRPVGFFLAIAAAVLLGIAGVVAGHWLDRAGADVPPPGIPAAGAGATVDPGGAASPARPAAPLATGAPVAREPPSSRVAVGRWQRDAIFGRVLGPSGDVLAGAEVTLPRERRGAHALTAADGSFRFEACEPAVVHRLHVAARGCAPANFDVVPGCDLVLGLPRAVRLHGRVTQAATPREGVLLAAAFGQPAVQLEVRTDAVGDYTLAAVPVAAHLVVNVVVPGGGLQRFPLLVGTQDQQFDIDLGEMPVVDGEIFDADTGAAVGNASLCVDDGTLVTHADAAGRFRLPLPPVGCTYVWAIAPGQAPTRCELAAPVADGPPLLQVGMRRGASLHGIVRDERGEPLAGVAVEVTCSESSVRPGQRAMEGRRPMPIAAPPANVLPPGCSIAMRGPAVAVTAVDGTFLLAGLGCGPGAFFAHVTARAAGRADCTPAAVPMAMPGGSGHVELQSAPAATLAGCVRQDGEGVRAQVELWLAGVQRQVASNDRGEFGFAGLPAGSARVVATRDGAPFVRAEVDVVVPAGGAVVQDIALRGRIGRITGTVRDTRGTPIAGISLQASAPSVRGLASTGGITDARGAFTLLVPDDRQPYRVHVAAPVEPFTRDDVVADGPPLELVLPATALVRIELVAAEPAATVAGCDFAWRHAAAARWHQTLGEPIASTAHASLTAFEMRLPVGALDLHIAPASGIHQEVVMPITVVAGDVPARVSVPLRTLPQLTIEVVGNRALLADHSLQLLRRDRDDGAWRGPRRDLEPEAHAIEPDPAGAARVDHVRPGRYGWSSEPDDLVLTPTEFDVAAAPAQQRVVVEVRARGEGGR